MQATLDAIPGIPVGRGDMWGVREGIAHSERNGDSVLARIDPQDLSTPHARATQSRTEGVSVTMFSLDALVRWSLSRDGTRERGEKKEETFITAISSNPSMGHLHAKAGDSQSRKSDGP